MLLKDYIKDTLTAISEKIDSEIEIAFDIGVFANSIEEIHVDEQSTNRIKFTISIASKQ